MTLATPATFRIDADATTRLRLDALGPVGSRAYWLADGSLVVPAYISRTGVQQYSYSDGTTAGEFRPASEVFAPWSIRSFEGLALTVKHPSAPVDTGNRGAVAVGFVMPDSLHKDGDYLFAELVITDKAVIKAVMDGELVEISAGYSCTLTATEGTLTTEEGDSYRAVQSNIFGNHVALLAAGEARAGSDARIYLDDKESAPDPATLPGMNKPQAHAGATMRFDTAAGALPPNPNPVTRTDNGPSSEIAALQAKVDAATARADRETVRADRAEAKVEALQAKVDAKESKTDTKATDPASVRRRVLAAVVLDSVDAALDFTKSDADLCKAAILRIDASAKLDGRSQDYLDARLDIAAEDFAKGKGKPRQDDALARAAGGLTEDSEDSDLVGKAKAANYASAARGYQEGGSK